MIIALFFLKATTVAELDPSQITQQSLEQKINELKRFAGLNHPWELYLLSRTAAILSESRFLAAKKPETNELICALPLFYTEMFAIKIPLGMESILQDTKFFLENLKDESDIQQKVSNFLEALQPRKIEIENNLDSVQAVLSQIALDVGIENLEQTFKNKLITQITAEINDEKKSIPRVQSLERMAERLLLTKKRHKISPLKENCKKADNYIEEIRNELENPEISLSRLYYISKNWKGTSDNTGSFLWAINQILDCNR